MRSVNALRTASGLTLLHAILHTVGGVFGAPPPGAGGAVYAAMQSTFFPAMGVARSYGQFYRGLGLGIAVYLTCEAIIFWQLGSLIRTQGTRLRPMLAVFAAAYVALAINSAFYFFSAPVVVELLIAACLVSAMATAQEADAA